MASRLVGGETGPDLTILKEDAALINKRVNLKELLSKHIIITGASGLIGINFIMSLREFCRKHKNSNPPIITAVFYNEVPRYFKEIFDFEGLMVKQGDITDPDFVDSLGSADYIIHSAGYAQPGKFTQDKIKTIAINTSATMLLLKKLNPGGKFLFVSSSVVYIGLPGTSYKENQMGTCKTDDPKACYIESKRCGETICIAQRSMGHNIKIARANLAYGPGTKPFDRRVLYSFIERAVRGEIKLVDAGLEKRTYCYISDAVEIMWKIILFGREPIYNVGGYSTTTIATLAKKIAKVLNAKVVIPKDGGVIAGSSDNGWLDMDKVAKEFTKKRKNYIDLDTGLKRTIEWQKEINKFALQERQDQ